MPIRNKMLQNNLISRISSENTRGRPCAVETRQKFLKDSYIIEIVLIFCFFSVNILSIILSLDFY